MSIEELNNIVTKFKPYEIYEAFKETYLILVKNDLKFATLMIEQHGTMQWFNIKVKEESIFTDWKFNNGNITEISSQNRVVRIDMSLPYSFITLNENSKSRMVLTSDILSTLVVKQREKKFIKV